MLDTEPEIPPTPSASGTAAVVSQAHGPRFVPSNFPVPQVMVCKGDKASNWEFFRQQYEDYKIAMELCQRQMSVHLASLCSIMGKECLQILWNLSLTAEQQATVKGCLDGLAAHFKPQRNVVYERYVFNSCVQIVEESVDVYVNRLRKLASSCEFGALTNELIRDWLVIGVKDRDLKGLSLQKAIEICKSNEITKQQLKSLENEEKKPHEEVNMCKQSGRRSSRTTIKPPAQDLKKKTPDFKYKPEKGNSKRKCKYCGKQMHNKRQDCPAFGSISTRILISKFSQWM